MRPSRKRAWSNTAISAGEAFADAGYAATTLRKIAAEAVVTELADALRSALTVGT